MQVWKNQLSVDGVQRNIAGKGNVELLLKFKKMFFLQLVQKTLKYMYSEGGKLDVLKADLVNFTKFPMEQKKRLFELLLNTRAKGQELIATAKSHYKGL